MVDADLYNEGFNSNKTVAEIFEILFYEIKKDELIENKLDVGKYDEWFLKLLNHVDNFKEDFKDGYTFLTYYFKDKSTLTIKDPSQIKNIPEVSVVLL